MITALAAAVLTVAVVVWFFVARSPAGLRGGRRSHTTTFGPADPGAEDQFVDRPGSAGPGQPS